MSTGRNVSKWRSQGIEVYSLSDLVELKRFDEKDIIITSNYDDFCDVFTSSI